MLKFISTFAGISFDKSVNLLNIGGSNIDAKKEAIKATGNTFINVLEDAAKPDDTADDNENDHP